MFSQRCSSGIFCLLEWQLQKGKGEGATILQNGGKYFPTSTAWHPTQTWISSPHTVPVIISFTPFILHFTKFKFEISVFLTVNFTSWCMHSRRFGFVHPLVWNTVSHVLQHLKYSGVCYNERYYNERILQRTVFINKNRKLQRTQMQQRTRRNIIGRRSTRVRLTCQDSHPKLVGTMTLLPPLCDFFYDFN